MVMLVAATVPMLNAVDAQLTELELAALSMQSRLNNLHKQLNEVMLRPPTVVELVLN
jgi:hypothetical protein